MKKGSCQLRGQIFILHPSIRRGQKCKTLHLGSSNPSMVYEMNTIKLADTSTGKDLGVFIGQDLKFHVNVTKAANNASRLLGPIRATFIFLDKTTVYPRRFKTMVRS